MINECVLVSGLLALGNQKGTIAEIVRFSTVGHLKRSSKGLVLKFHEARFKDLWGIGFMVALALSLGLAGWYPQ